MHLYFELLGISVPAYGLMIVIGVILANFVAYINIRVKRQDINDFLIIEAYTFIGAFIGAKALYLVVTFKTIEWIRLLEMEYFNQIMQGGFVFYGGLLGGLLMAYYAGKIHKIDSKFYIREYIFLIPLIHCFGRIGCFCAGCCYGIPYTGFGAVVFPRDSFAPCEISLFPIQLIEAIVLLLISGTIFMLQVQIKCEYTIETYSILYGISRFILEYLRYDPARGKIWVLSTSQWISMILVILAVICIYSKSKYKKKINIIEADGEFTT